MSKKRFTRGSRNLPLVFYATLTGIISCEIYLHRWKYCAIPNMISGVASLWGTTTFKIESDVVTEGIIILKHGVGLSLINGSAKTFAVPIYGNSINLDLSPSTPGSTLPSGGIVCSRTNRSSLCKQKKWWWDSIIRAAQRIIVLEMILVRKIVD